MCTAGSVTSRTRPDLQQGMPYWFSLVDSFYIDLSISDFQDLGHLACARMLHTTGLIGKTHASFFQLAF